MQVQDEFANKFAGLAGTYTILSASKLSFINDPSSRDIYDGDTRTIYYLDGPLKGREIEQVFQGDYQTGGWVDTD